MRTLRFKLCILVALTAAFAGSCQKENDSKVEKNGLTKEINDIVPEALLDTMKNIGLPIYIGENPPNIENSFLVSPLILLKSNIPTDYSPGHRIEDFYIKFYKQDNNNLSVSINTKQAYETGIGIGAFIVGDNNNFSVFAKSKLLHTDGDSASVVNVYSGKIVDGGIKDYYYAIFMIDNYGNPHDRWIGNGAGRIFYDGDGFSEEIPDFQSSLKALKQTGLLLGVTNWATDVNGLN